MPDELSGLRLDKALATHPQINSRTRAAKLIETHGITKNGGTVKASQLTKAGETYRVQLPQPESSDLKPLDLKLDILHEDAEVIVVNKPAGLVVHPAAGHAQDTLVNALIHHTPDLAMGFGEQRPGIVHRLDKDTSGVLVVAKTDQAQTHLAAQFKARTIHRVYWAIAHGTPVKPQGTIESYLRRHPTDRKRFASEKLRPGQKPSGKRALTHYALIKSHLLGLSLLRVRLETGRTHQIRIHLSELGHPLIGDWLYGAKAQMTKVKSETLRQVIQPMGRIGLHAAELGFVHPRTQQSLIFKAPWPDDLKDLLSLLEWL
ncbi:MAG: RluA family pseudouridine synthase [Bdellovibrionales bacterium]